MDYSKLVSTSGTLGEHELRPTEDPEILEQLQRAQEDRPKGETFVEEQALALKEMNSHDASRYRLTDQDHHTSEKERLGNFLHWKDFVRKLENILGHSSIYIHKPPAGPNNQFENIRGLFVRIRGQERKQFTENGPTGWKCVGAMQVPYMSEWGVLHQDEHGVFKNEKYKGWRTVLMALILNDAITEQEAHQEFGSPTLGIQSRLYNQKLRGKREQK